MGFEQYVPNVHFEQIPIKNLVSNQEYQRNLSQLHIKRTADHSGDIVREHEQLCLGGAAFTCAAARA